MCGICWNAWTACGATNACLGFGFSYRDTEAHDSEQFLLHDVWFMQRPEGRSEEREYFSTERSSCGTRMVYITCGSFVFISNIYQVKYCLSIKGFLNILYSKIIFKTVSFYHVIVKQKTKVYNQE